MCIRDRPRSDEPALPYNELISSPVYFSNDKWLECLKSHGVIVDTENKTLTIQSEKVNADMVYDLTAVSYTHLDLYKRQR